MANSHRIGYYGLDASIPASPANSATVTTTATMIPAFDTRTVYAPNAAVIPLWVRLHGGYSMDRDHARGLAIGGFVEPMVRILDGKWHKVTAGLEGSFQIQFEGQGASFNYAGLPLEYMRTVHDPNDTWKNGGGNWTIDITLKDVPEKPIQNTEIELRVNMDYLKKFITRKGDFDYDPAKERVFVDTLSKKIEKKLRVAL